MKKIIPLVIAAAFLAGCGANQSYNKATSMVSENDLLHHNFVLISVDGQSPVKTPGPSIEFGENMHISGAMCNRFMGQGELKNGVLTVKGLASTRMLCSEKQLNQWDALISQVLNSGAKVTLNKGQLTLSNNDHTLLYQLKDWVN
ncbi:heat shock protein HslJ [Yersinia kristensenii]|uniref:heat shock protein HslJ n=1 Tax=Yersinia kristensenii TaxID=28152 RepID=UPI0001A54BFF|nr:heat shock protein HslJ [Yersinia kristensenii]EEP91942.1 Heat shock protein [Yersinia kristensenii ATCC 33638]PEH52367.1 heat-inducible protein [Yersinia kristensenii]SUP70181.1 heat-inducible protein [Yersinia kristensenii]